MTAEVRLVAVSSPTMWGQHCQEGFAQTAGAVNRGENEITIA